VSDDRNAAMDDRLALFGVLQELTVAALDLFDPTRSLDDVLQTIAQRLGCRVALCLESIEGSRVTLRGAAGLARASRDLLLPYAVKGNDNWAALPLPYPEVVAPELVRWVIYAEGDRPHLISRPWWLVFYFEREPRLPRQYRGMLTRLAHHLDLAFEHRRLNESLERRVAERTAQLAATNKELMASIETLGKTQEQLLQAGKLAAVGQLAAGVAHEINNPLAVILGFAQGLERRLEPNDPKTLPITSIVREALRCKTLVQELLTFSRTAKKTAEDVDPNALIKGALQLLDVRARPQNTKIELILDENIGVIRANGSQLQQVIVNLGNNALDALKEGGVVRLKTGRVGQGVFVAVEDTGPGMPRDVEARIFEPFFTTKEVGKGTGLGLSLAYEIVRQHGGRIEVETEVGCGTIMTVRLPREDASSGSTPQPKYLTVTHPGTKTP
jgi:signal transduction histidine kinase